MANWNSSFQQNPQGGNNPQTGYQQISETRTEFTTRFANEHSTYLSGGGSPTADGLHLPGSAVAFHQTSTPTTRLNGGSLVNGLIWCYPTTNELRTYSGGSWNPPAPKVALVTGSSTFYGSFFNNPWSSPSFSHGLGSNWSKVCRFALCLYYRFSSNWRYTQASAKWNQVGTVGLDSTYIYPGTWYVNVDGATTVTFYWNVWLTP